MATPSSPSLRPLSIGEILDAGIKVVLRNWKMLIACTAALMAPIAIVYVLAIASIDPEQLELIPEDTQSEPELPEASVFVGLGLTYVLGIVALLICFGTCYKAVSDAWLGKRPEVGESLRYGMRRAPMVFVLGLIQMLFTLVAWIPCCIPLIWLGVYWSLSFPALLFERVGPFKALGRSYNLIKGRWWATFALLIVSYLLVSIISGILQLPLLIVAELVAGESALANGLSQGIGTTIGFAITYPYVIAVLTILYFDQRVRKEGFDLQLMAEGLGIEADPNAPFPAELTAPPKYTPEQMAAAPYWPPPPGWEPPPGAQPPPGWSSPTGWTAPTAPQGPSPGGAPPSDDRPAGESPWMTPSPGGAPPGRWAPPAGPPSPGGGEPPPEEPPPEEPPPEEPPPDEPPQWPPPERPRGPEGL